MGGGRHHKLSALDGGPTGHEVAIIAGKAAHTLSPFRRISAGRVRHFDPGINSSHSPDAETERFPRKIAKFTFYRERRGYAVFRRRRRGRGRRALRLRSALRLRGALRL